MAEYKRERDRAHDWAPCNFVEYWLINYSVTQWIWFASLIFLNTYIFVFVATRLHFYLSSLVFRFSSPNLSLVKKYSGTILFIPKFMNFIFISNENQFPFTLEWHYFHQAIIFEIRWRCYQNKSIWWHRILNLRKSQLSL